MGEERRGGGRRRRGLPVTKDTKKSRSSGLASGGKLRALPVTALTQPDDVPAFVNGLAETLLVKTKIERVEM